ncbi:thioredoxin domain-containing protein, partial [Natronoarchaeum mannanilyticum]
RVADAAIDELHDEGSFRDGPANGEGLLDRPLRPLDGNVEMTDALLDLAVLTGEDRYRDVARETIEAFAGAWDRFGPQVAGYGSAASRLLNGTLVIRVGDDAGSDLHRAALRMGDHEKVVVPEAEGVEDGTAAASIVTGDERSSSSPRSQAREDAAATAEPAETPEQLEARVSDLIDERSEAN